MKKKSNIDILFLFVSNFFPLLNTNVLNSLKSHYIHKFDCKTGSQMLNNFKLHFKVKSAENKRFM